MKRLLLCVAIAVAISAVASGQPAAGKAEELLMQMERDWLNGFVKGDPAIIERIEAADFTYTDAQGKTTDRAQDVSDVKTGNFKPASAEVDQMTVRVFGNTAIVTGRSTLKGARYQGKDISGQYRFTDVFVKRGGRWQAVASQSTRIAQE